MAIKLAAKEASNYIVYVVYGDDQTYYQGARFGMLSFMAHWSSEKKPHIIVITEKPDIFRDLPVDVITITPELKAEWSLNGQYHFRIKNRGLRFLFEQYDFSENDKILFLDTDTYFTHQTEVFFNNISPSNALMFFPETNISQVSEDNEYSKIIGTTFEFDGMKYQVDNDSVMWASAVIGLMPCMANELDYADRLMQCFRQADCKAHTIEQFALSEALRRNYTLVAAKNWVNHYSTSGRKDYARGVLADFFKEHGHRSFDEQIKAAGKVSFRRTLSAVIRGHIYKKKKKLKALLKK